MMRRLRLLVPVLILALVAVACGNGNDTITLTATFDDVGDLVTRAHVRAGDVPIGLVTDIQLTDDHRALVTMVIDRDTGLPAETEAALDRTSLLGERYIDLRPLGEGGALQDGQHLEHTRLVTDFEQLVATGNNLLSAVAIDKVGAALETGAIAFGGRGALLGSFIDNVQGFVGRYHEGEDDLLRTIDTLEALTASLAPDAELHAESLAVLERASRVLEEEDDRLLDALSDLTELAEVGEEILASHRQEIDDSIRRLRILLAQVTRIDGALDNVLTWLPRHNLHVPNGVIYDQSNQMYFGQVWLDFVVCGVNDTPGDPSRACDPPNPGQQSPPSGKQWMSDECYDDLEACREETDARRNR